MQLDEIKLHNYKLHRDLTVKLGPGVIGIIGSNGSGKSSVISAIRFLFTGDVDADTKDEVISTGETEGWVSGSFTLNGKEGYLERHLSASKVILRYNGVTYNKATEVKELWTKLLQIDSAIFNNVIVAAQGEIPLLFSGDNATRERIFQKIFMVPPTEKLRTTIWEHYIKTCPPEKFEEDVGLLQAKEVEVAKQNNQLLAEIQAKQLDVLSEQLVTCIHDRLAYLGRCKTDAVLRPALEAKLAEAQAQLARVQRLKQEEEQRLSAVDPPRLRKDYDLLLSQKRLATHKSQLAGELAQYQKSAPSPPELALAQDEVKRLTQQEQEAKQSLDEANAVLKHATAQCTDFAKLDGCTTCPTCKQPVTDLVAALKERQAEETNARRKVVAANAAFITVGKKAARVRNDLSVMDSKVQHIQNLQQQLARYSTVTFSDEALDTLGRALAGIEQAQARVQKLTNDAIRLAGEIDVVQEKQKNLAVYDGRDSIEEELGTMQSALEENKRRQGVLEDTRVEQAKLQHELTLLDDRVESSLVNHEYNVKRRAYLEKLNKAYEVLHVSQFPRKLIQQYADVVQLHLASYLEKFTIPYRPRIVEGFKILMLDADGKKVPSVSGGQEMMVGICLRLALHRMFAQSFPLWIVDEGTTHLDTENRAAYFQLIETIRQKKLINQILIIDHDPALGAVVDKTIKL